MLAIQPHSSNKDAGHSASYFQQYKDLGVQHLYLKVFGDATLYVSCGGPLTRSGGLLNIEGMSLDVVVNSAVATQHYTWI